MPLYRMDLTVTERHSFIFEAPNADKAEEYAEALYEAGTHEARDLDYPDRDHETDVSRAGKADAGLPRISAKRVKEALHFVGADTAEGEGE